VNVRPSAAGVPNTVKKSALTRTTPTRSAKSVPLKMYGGSFT
jgi:hypothetical protein